MCKVGAVRPLKNFMHPLGICKISKTNMLISLLKKTCDNVGIQAFPLMNRCGWKPHTFKNKYYQDVLCNLVEQMLIFLKEGG
jgi:hypothetical protein